MTKRCDIHDASMEKIHDKISKNTETLAVVKTDVEWIKENIREALSKKKWLMTTIVSVIALLIGLYGVSR